MRGHKAALATGLSFCSAVTVVLLSLAGRWKAGEGTPQDAGALGEQGCRWEAALCAWMAGSGMPLLSSPLAVPSWPGLCWDSKFSLQRSVLPEQRGRLWALLTISIWQLAAHHPAYAHWTCASAHRPHRIRGVL